MLYRILLFILCGLFAGPGLSAQSCADYGCTECSWVCHQSWSDVPTVWTDRKRDPPIHQRRTGRGAQPSPKHDAETSGVIDAYEIDGDASGYSKGPVISVGPDFTEIKALREVKFTVRHVNTCDGCDDRGEGGRAEFIADVQFRASGRIHRKGRAFSEAEAEMWVEVYRIPDNPGGGGPNTSEQRDSGDKIFDCRTDGGFKLAPSGGHAWSRGGKITVEGPPSGAPKVQGGGASSGERRVDLGNRHDVSVAFAPRHELGCDVELEETWFNCYLGCELKKFRLKLDPDGGRHAGGETHIETLQHSLTVNLRCDNCGESSSKDTLVFDLNDRGQDDPCH